MSTDDRQLTLIARLQYETAHILSTEECILLKRERQRIARDLHDGVVQRLVYTLQKLEMVRQLLEKRQIDEACQEAIQAHAQLVKSLHELRHCIASPLPLQLEEQPLLAALHTLIGEQQQMSPATTIISDIDRTTAVPPILEVPIFRFVQEALDNVHKHARATQVQILLRTIGGLLVVEVSDNGVGFAGKTDAHEERLGLRTMRERVQEVGGIWELQNRPGMGTTVKAHFSLSDYPTLEG